MTTQSEKIFRGTLIDAAKTKVNIGGGEIAAVVYTFDVTEVFKGQVQTVKDRRVAKVTMLGTLQKQQAGQRVLPGLPLLSTGKQYLLMVAPAGPTGLTTTMGLGQGAFQILSGGKTEVAVNEFNNIGLFTDTSQPGARIAAPVSAGSDRQKGAIPYTELAAQIHTLLGQ
ncbi:hypothetical protein FKG94_00525 [Exilibacterium tricleocarpae]|uniref:Uncharacterized protein n=1 Tax=Exilibacterium tricleocarpae TaxID=2591008 RepID=A0A545U9G4_9GAMM|nr:hypothetical protein [Exilibacterium tricleocarpae]TQV86079.1 hypothetical protein FKG94_00525 [Exilibacterium tricleocarpae]